MAWQQKAKKVCITRMIKLNNKEYGIVYLLTNPVMPGWVKIGMTTQEDIDKQMKELYTTGVPIPFECWNNRNPS